MPRIDLTADMAREIIEYNPETGEMLWKPRGEHWFNTDGYRTAKQCADKWNTRLAGKRCGYFNKDGYIEAAIKYGRFKMHRVAWLIYYGDWPIGEIDHINNDRSDNRISNLRIATRNENSWNRPIQANNKTGYKGVSLKNDGKYQANIKSRGKQLFLGTFSCPIEAHEAYKKAATELHGEFRNYG